MSFFDAVSNNYGFRKEYEDNDTKIKINIDKIIYAKNYGDYISIYFKDTHFIKIKDININNIFKNENGFIKVYHKSEKIFYFINKKNISYATDKFLVFNEENTLELKSNDNEYFFDTCGAASSNIDDLL